MPLKVHFLNVGQGDCTIVEFPSGRVAVVDIHNLPCLDAKTKSELLAEYHESLAYLLLKQRGNSESQLDAEYIRSKEAELTDPLAYYDAHVGTYKDIFRMIVTHPDMDHMTGLHRLHEQDSRKSILNFWHIGPHDFNLASSTDEEWEQSRFDKRDWITYKALRNSTNAPKSLTKRRGATGSYWTEDGVELWAPTDELVNNAVESETPNQASMILKLTHAGRSIVLGGDADESAWEHIYPRTDMKSVDVLKASHHGRNSGFHLASVKEMSPWLTITSVSQRAHDATDRYRRQSQYTVSLLDAGNITITIQDNGQLLYSPNAADHWKSKLT